MDALPDAEAYTNRQVASSSATAALRENLHSILGTSWGWDVERGCWQTEGTQ